MLDIALLDKVRDGGKGVAREDENGDIAGLIIARVEIRYVIESVDMHSIG
jgi:hypothetical protein